MRAPTYLSAATAGGAGDATASRRARPRRRWPALLITGTALCFLVAPAARPARLRLVWNVSASVPVGLYRIVPVSPPRVGELVAVRPSPALAKFMANRRYVEAGALLVKPVAAVAGQRVCRTGAIVTIDRAAVAVALAADRRHRPLPVWSGCRPLRAGAVFLLAPAMRASFDSRYFGPVAVDQIVGRAVPVWTRG